MELQVVEPFALEVAQRAAKVRDLAALVLQMTSDVALELVLLGAAHAAVHAVLAHVLAHNVYFYKTIRQKAYRK